MKVDKNRILYGGNINKRNREINDVQIIEIDDKFENIQKIYTVSRAYLKENDKKWYFENLNGYDTERHEKISLEDDEYVLEIEIDELLADPVVPKNLNMPELREKIVYFNRVGADVADSIIGFLL